MTGSLLLVCPAEREIPTPEGWTVERAEDGYRAIELAERVHPGVVLVHTDVTGPELPDLIRRLRAVDEDARVLFVLSESSGELAAELLRAGADGILDPDPDEAHVTWAVEQARAGGYPLGPGIARQLAVGFADTARREQEWSRSLASLARQAEELGSAKAEFLSNLSHELRTPLTVIKGVAQVVGKFGGGDQQQQTMLTQLEEAATKLARMVENLLVLAEMERGEFRLDIADCDMAELVREGTDEGSARYPSVKVELMVPQSIPARADGERIREVVRHLVDNACRYSEDGDTVTVQAKQAVEGVVVSVTDRGRGVDRKVVTAAFGQAFSPGEEVLTKDRAGLGLGLNLARNLIVQHGGILSAEPLPGGGSKVSFVLPPEPPQQVEEETPAGGGAEMDGDPLEMLRSLQQRLADSEARAAQ